MKPVATVTPASGTTNKAMSQWEAGWDQTFPNTGRNNKRTGVAAQ